MQEGEDGEVSENADSGTDSDSTIGSTCAVDDDDDIGNPSLVSTSSAIP